MLQYRKSSALKLASEEIVNNVMQTLESCSIATGTTSCTSTLGSACIGWRRSLKMLCLQWRVTIKASATLHLVHQCSNVIFHLKNSWTIMQTVESYNITTPCTSALKLASLGRNSENIYAMESYNIDWATTPCTSASSARSWWNRETYSSCVT